MEFGKTFLDTLDHLGVWGVLITDAQLVITGWNRWLEQRSGKPFSSVVGRRLFEVYPELLVRSVDRYYKQALEGQSCMLSQRFHKYLLPMPPTVAETTLMQMQQTSRLWPVLENGEVTGTLTLIEDVTERIVTENELREQADRLEEANRHKDEFLAMLAHELRNPLAPIRNGIRVLDLVEGDSSEARQTRQMIDRQVTHMARLVEDLLDVSRIAQGKVQLREEHCDLCLIVGAVVDDYRAIIEANGLNLRFVPSNDSCAVRGDPVRLAQIVGNLLHNANKFTNPGGEIRVECLFEASSGRALVRIADSGIGMSYETLSRVFDTFSQADVSLDRSKGGLGLGLALAKGLTELQAGTIAVSSPGLGQGSTFTIAFPRYEMTSSPDAEPTQRDAVPQSGKRVLVIEDNRDTALTVKALLKLHGFEVDVEYSGPSGVEAARRIRPNIVLCDIGLPGMDGFAVAEAIRSDPTMADAYLIAQSGYGRDEDRQKAYDAGFNLHLTKPVDFGELQRVLMTSPVPTKR